MKPKRVYFLLLPIVIALFSVGIVADLLRASDFEGAPAARDLVVVADTTGTMQPQLDALANAWPGSVLPGSQQEQQFHLVQYKDAVRYEGSTGSVGQFQNKLNELEAAGGAECEDAMFQALAAAARGAPDSRALVLTDSAPQGGPSNLAFVMNKLVERGVNVYPLVSGWCESSELSQAAMFSLARMTGGVATIHEAVETEAAVRGALNLIPLQDTILVENAAVDGIEVYPLVLDSTATTLGVEDKPCERTWCLTCTLAVQQTASLVEAASDIQLMVKDPDGNLLQAGDAGVEMLQTSGGVSYLIDVAQVYTPPAGKTSSTWEIIVKGTGDHVLSAVSDSAVHLDLLGKHILPANKPSLMRASLATEAVSPAVVASSVQFALKNAANDRVMPIDLFDDGQHSDGQAGDGIYGGPVKARRGLWYLAVSGELSDGARFERMHEVPIRVKGFRATQSGDQQQVAGNSSTLQFLVTNDEEDGLNQVSSKVYELSLNSLLGWSSAEGVPQSIVLAPGETRLIEALVTVPQDADPGEVEETFLTIVESNDFGSSETLTVKTTVVEKMTVYLPATLGH